MCILFVYTNPNPPAGGYRLILASNRDEVLKRPAVEAHHWSDDEYILGGRDMEKNREGGTWLGLSTRPVEMPSYLRVAALLNVTGEPRLLQGRGRGNIVANYIKSENKARDYIEDLRIHAKEYNAFNFIAIEIADKLAKIYHFSNVGDRTMMELDASGGLGLGNSLPEAPLAKVRAGEERFQDIISTYHNIGDKDKLAEEIFYLLKWEDKHLPDPELARRAPDWKNYLSSIFVNIPEVGYGTRTHTIILVDDKGKIDLLEDTMQSPIQVEQPVWRLQRLISHL